jgi:hypothetical protein
MSKDINNGSGHKINRQTGKSFTDKGVVAKRLEGVADQGQTTAR